MNLEEKLGITTEYLKFGWKLVPVKPFSKIPIKAGWTDNPITDIEEMTQYFEKNLDTNVGVVCGKASGIVVIDLDLEKDKVTGEYTGYEGLTSLRQQEALLKSPLPDTVTSQTQSGAYQLWFKYPKGVSKITSTVDKLRSVDIRGDGSQVVVYPSVGEKGNYSWLMSPTTTKLAELPKEWVKFLCEETQEDKTLKLAIIDKFELPVEIAPSKRNDTLFKYACSLVAKNKDKEEKDKQSYQDIFDEVARVNEEHCTIPLGEKEVEVLVDSAFRTNQRSQERKNEVLAQLVSTTSENGLADIVPDLDKVSNMQSMSAKWVIMNEKGGISIDEPIFSEIFTNVMNIYFVNGKFYNEDGALSDSAVKQVIQNVIKPFVRTNLSSKVNALFGAVQNHSHFIPPTPKHDIINFKNCSIRVTKDKLQEVEKPFTFNRLNILYNSSARNQEWETYVNNLLYADDVLTLQEYIGYSLIPTTKGQKAMFILGDGGEGKSGISVVLSKLFGNSVVSGKFHDIGNNQFLTANLENKLLFIDDDIDLNYMDNTGTFKKYVTAQERVTVERKGIQPYEILPFCRFLCLGNGMIKAKYDTSDGFWDRLLVMRVKPIKRRGSDNEDSSLYEKISLNMAGIINWALEGLQRLMRNNWHFTISDSTRKETEKAKEEDNNLVQFFDPEINTSLIMDRTNTTVDISCKELWDFYNQWCLENSYREITKRAFELHLKKLTKDLNIRDSRSIKRNGKYVRGYVGIGFNTIRLKEDEEK